uniref:PAS domain-containing protein n=1 Tax=Leptospirillum ferriphilum TaxID=178606 RepID=A0A7C3QXE7_9BACT
MNSKILTPEEIGALLAWTPSGPSEAVSSRKPSVRTSMRSGKPSRPKNESNVPVSENDFFRDVLDAMGEAMIITDFRGRILFENVVSRDLLDKPLSAIRRKSFRMAVTLLDGDGQRQDDDPVGKVLRAQRPFRFPAGSRLLRPDGSSIPVDGSATPVFRADGEPEGVVVSFHRRNRPAGTLHDFSPMTERHAR